MFFKKILVIVALLVCLTSLYSQNKIVLETLDAKNSTVFYITNKSHFTHKVKLKIISSHFKNGFKIVSKKLKPNTKKRIYRLKSKIDIEFKTDLDYKKKASKKEILKEELLLATRKFNLNTDNINNGIVIFSKKTCSRCRLAENYLDQNNIAYKKIAIDESAAGKKLMWKMVRGNSTEYKRIKTPVIVIDGKVSYSHENLVQFLKDIK